MLKIFLGKPITFRSRGTGKPPRVVKQLTLGRGLLREVNVGTLSQVFRRASSSGDIIRPGMNVDDGRVQILEITPEGELKLDLSNESRSTIKKSRQLVKKAETIMEQDARQAISTLQEAVRIWQNNIKAWNNLGTAHHDLREYKEAKVAFKQVLKIDPKYAVAWHNLGTVYCELGEYKKARAALRQALKIDPKYAKAWRKLHVVYVKLGKYEDAIAAYRQEIKIEPDSPWGWVRMGGAQYDLGQYEKARSSFRKAYDMFFDGGSTLQALAHEAAMCKAMMLRCEANLFWNEAKTAARKKFLEAAVIFEEIGYIDTALMLKTIAKVISLDHELQQALEADSLQSMRKQLTEISQETKKIRFDVKSPETEIAQAKFTCIRILEKILSQGGRSILGQQANLNTVFQGLEQARRVFEKHAFAKGLESVEAIEILAEKSAKIDQENEPEYLKLVKDIIRLSVNMSITLKQRVAETVLEEARNHFSPEAFGDIGQKTVRTILDFQDTARKGDRAMPRVDRKQLAAFFSGTEMPREGQETSEVFDEVKRNILPHIPHLQVTSYIAHMTPRSPAIAAYADALTSAINTNQVAFEASTATAYCERQVLNWMRTMMGYQEMAVAVGEKITDPGGILTSGGTIANMTALLVARNHALHKYFKSIGQEIDITETGLWGIARPEKSPPLARNFVVLTSAEAHYSHPKIGGYIGLGSDNVLKVPVDDHFRMDVRKLEEMIQRTMKENKVILAILATAGTTETGNFDPLKDIAEVAKRHDIWLHVDAAFAGPIKLSEKYSHLVAGIEEADSITIDPHKWLFMPYSLGAVLFRDIGVLETYLKQSADYAIRSPKDLGMFSVEGSKRFYALKLWMTLKVMGTKSMEAMIDYNIEMAKYLSGKLSKLEDFEHLSEPVIDIFCFRFLPKELRMLLQSAIDTGDIPSIRAINEKVGKLNIEIQGALEQSGKGHLSRTKMEKSKYSRFQQAEEKITALRIVIMNPDTDKEVLDKFVSDFQEICNSVYAAWRSRNGF